eukprot:753925-Hanusia_phi.AAC.5
MSREGELGRVRGGQDREGKRKQRKSKGRKGTEEGGKRKGRAWRMRNGNEFVLAFVKGKKAFI